MTACDTTHLERAWAHSGGLHRPLLTSSLLGAPEKFDTSSQPMGDIAMPAGRSPVHLGTPD